MSEVAVGRDVRHETLQRDEYTCQHCGYSSQAESGLQVHHIHRQGAGGPDTLPNLVTLCSRCHAVAHSRADGEIVPLSVLDGFDPLHGELHLSDIDRVLLDYLQGGRITAAHARQCIVEDGVKESISGPYVTQRLQRFEEHGHVTNLYDSGLYELVRDLEDGDQESDQ